MTQDIYSRITEKVIAGLEKDGLKWFRPWSGNDLGMPVNNSTGKAYKGINIFLLSAACVDRGFKYNEWMTYKQCSDKGGQVRKGAKSEFVVYYAVSFKHQDGTWYPNEQAVLNAYGTTKDCTKIFKPKYFNVFNIADCENIEPRFPVIEKKHEDVGSTKAADYVFNLYPADVRPTWFNGGSSAHYVPSKHHIQMPEQNDFETAEAYCHTFFHELIHSTGHKSCLNRAGVAKTEGFGTDSYAVEELVAEIGAQFISATVGIDYNDDNSQAYINGWVKKLKEDKKIAMQAASQAMKATDFIFG